MRPYLIINKFIDKSIIFVKQRKVYFLILFLLVFFAPLFILAQTVYFDPQNIRVGKNTNFSLPLKINSVNNLFAVNFDLNFDPSLVEYMGTTEGNFLSQGCSTALMVSPSSPGKIIFGLTRLGASCGGVSGSGLIATLNFKSLEKEGTGTQSFSNNNLCILSGSSCNYIVGQWLPASVTVGEIDAVPPVRSNGSPSGTLPAGTTQATLSLTTDESATCRYSIVASTIYSSMANTFSVTGGVSHSTAISGLQNGMNYNYYVRCQDAAGNANTDDYIIVFSVVAPADTTPPTISAVSASSLTSNSATIIWTTNEVSDSQVEYGLTTNYGSQTVLSSSMVTSHSQALSGLSPSTAYHYRVKSRDGAGNLGISGNYTFMTTVAPDTTPPIRSSGTPLDTLSFGTTQITMSLTTNENATCRFSIIANTVFGSMTNTFSTTGGTSHSTTLTGLTNGSTYTRYIRCQDSAGNVNLDDYIISFSVASDNIPPVISSISVSSIGANSATISWTTNEPADSQVEYGLSSSYGNQTNLDLSLVTGHNIIINGLSVGTLYHFRVRSKDSNANLATSGDYTFSTLSIQSFCPGGWPGGR